LLFDNILQPLLLSVLAGLATGIGGLLILFLGKIEERFLGLLMGFAGGVMLTVSFLELFTEAVDISGMMWSVVFFALGAIAMMVLDQILPHMEFGEWEKGVKDREIMNSGLTVALGMSLHNLPEGLVVSAGFVHAPSLGIFVALMIALHNIPEGIATVMPLMSAGMSKGRAVAIATLSGLMEPIGALLGLIILMFAGGSGLVSGFGLAFAAGVMTNVTIDELIPVAHSFCKPIHKHYVSGGVLIGILFAQIIRLIFL
jgi:ZIP family zinc transporter